MHSIKVLIVPVLLSIVAHARADTPTVPQASAPGALDDVVAAAVRGARERVAEAKLRDEDLAVTVIDLRDAAKPRAGGFRGDVPIYPASVVKLFYLAAAHRWLEDGKLQDSEELRRMLRDMIVDSSNDATGAVVDALSGVGNGEPLGEADMKAWAERRHAVNRYFASLGYAGINVCQKAYAEGPYGRERVFLGAKYENRNKLTTGATARLMVEIVQGKAVSPARSAAMMELLRRDPTAKPDGPDDQATGYTAKALPAGSKLWSKAGWTSTARHDAAYVETPDGQKFVLVIFTTGHARNRDLLPAIAGGVIDGLKGPPAPSAGG